METINLQNLNIMEIVKEIGSIMSLDEFCNKLLIILKKLIPYNNGHFIFYDPDNNLLPLSYRYNISDKTHNEYLKYYCYKDDFMLNALNTYEPKRSTDIMNYTQWKKSEYFNDFHLKYSFYYIAILDIHYKNQLISSLSLIRNKKSEDFNTDELLALKILSPYIANNMYKLIIIKKYEKSHKNNIIKTIDNSKREYNFTDRELDIIDYIIKGKTNDEISDLLYISTETVKKHINNIFKKTNVKNRTEVLAKFLYLI